MSQTSPERQAKSYDASDHPRCTIEPVAVAPLKANLRSRYEASPGAPVETDDTQQVTRTTTDEEDAEEAVVSGAFIPIPTETFIAVATERIRELEEFAAQLRAVEEQGFACPALDELLTAEPLDRWSGDGVFPPADRAALLAQEQAWQVDINDGVRVNIALLQGAGLLAGDVLAADRATLLAQEQAWRVDINDGVRVNIAPLQGAGLLAGDVLAAKELPKAIADRARWLSDERRWVRAGELPRCG
jgi:hypothetical protein